MPVGEGKILLGFWQCLGYAPEVLSELFHYHQSLVIAMGFTTSQRILIPFVLGGLALVASLLLVLEGLLPVPLATLVLFCTALAVIFVVRKQFIVEEEAFVYKTLWKKYRYPYSEYSFSVLPLVGLLSFRTTLRATCLQLAIAPVERATARMPDAPPLDKWAHSPAPLVAIPLALSPEDTLEFLDTLQEGLQDAAAGSVGGSWWPK